jgi:hypothetical protein
MDAPAIAPSQKQILPGQDENGVDVSQTDYLLSLTPEQRLEMLGRWMDFDKAITDARIKQYGFDPRDVVEAE